MKIVFTLTEISKIENLHKDQFCTLKCPGGNIKVLSLYSPPITYLSISVLCQCFGKVISLQAMGGFYNSGSNWLWHLQNWNKRQQEAERSRNFWSSLFSPHLFLCLIFSGLIGIIYRWWRCWSIFLNQWKLINCASVWRLWYTQATDPHETEE